MNHRLLPMFVLFVDDDRDDYELFCEAMQSVNSAAKCLYVHDGTEAIKFLNTATILPDYIFLDINMPIMGGEECLIAIKKKKHLRGIPIIMYSTTRNAVESETLKRLGAMDFIVKPGKYSDLVEILKKVLQDSAKA